MRVEPHFLYTPILLILLNNTLFSQNVTRGPYLQLGTHESIVVRWRTDVSMDSRVTIGNAPGNLTIIFDDPNPTTEHEVSVNSLTSDTRYYYSIGSSSVVLAGDDTAHFFVTSPQPGTSKPTRIWVLGDVGTADDSARATRDAYYNFTGSTHTDLWLTLGDNAYPNGTDGQHQNAIFEDMFEVMLRKSVFWPSIGNHDINTSSSPGPYPYMDIFTLPTNGEAGGVASGTEHYCSFDYGNIHFIILNSSNSALRNANSAMWTWLQADLAQNNRFWTVAYWHHPPYSKGSHDSDSENDLKEMRENALPILESAGVDLVMAGHSHSYERSFLIDGHYGLSSTLTVAMKVDSGDGRPDGDGAYEKDISQSTANKGAVYIVLGTSGWPQNQGSLDHAVMVTSFIRLGSVVLDVHQDTLEAKFIDYEGNIDDYFTLIKNSTSPNQTEAIFRIERTTGNVYADGVFIAGGADFAERIKVSEPVEPGDVVELDPYNPQHYRKARGDGKLLAGVIATEPGFVVGNQIDKGKASAAYRPMLVLLGRVPVKVSAENGAICPGDLLTLSSKPGIAMRANAVNSQKPIIGKALEGLESGSGKVLVLVSTY